MVPVRRLYQLWSWLPHFRAVAETQHVGRAAAMLRITAPAISRALARLEAEVGAPLFDRRGRSIALNPAGEALASVMRDSMRQIDDVVAAIGAEVTMIAPTSATYFVVVDSFDEAESGEYTLVVTVQ
ncbi:MAG: LysR family transcriptional regulator [Kofleriaceae bacterium]|nr:LysR family transcriptional regulator [Kofleriaceae bacterium]